MPETIEIDGSFGEGGGQILRTSLALSLITRKPFHLSKVRANRKPKPGLQPQHLMSVRAAAQIGSAKLRGDSIGSSDLTFEPGQVRAGNYRFAIGTAGATALVLHTVYLPLMWQADGPSEVVLEGGTHVSTSPCYDFLATTWRAYMARLGLNLRLEMTRPGFYPRGGGQVVAHLQPASSIQPLHLTMEIAITKAVGFSAVAGLPDHVAKRQARRAVTKLADAGIEAEIDQVEWPGGPGSVLGTTFTETPVPTFFFGIGAKGKPAETVGEEAAEQAVAFAKAKMPVDPHSADQILLPLALSQDASEYRVQEVTRHLTTNAAVIRMFLDRDITIEGDEGGPGTVRIAAS